jgi:hypothetical protein
METGGRLMVVVTNYRPPSLIIANSLLIRDKITSNHIGELERGYRKTANSLIREKDPLFNLKKEKNQKKEITIYKAKQPFLRREPVTRRFYGHFKCCRRV